MLHPLASRPLIGHVLATAQSSNLQILVAVTAPDMNDVNDVARSYVPTIASQTDQTPVTVTRRKPLYPYRIEFYRHHAEAKAIHR
ncbi:MAG: hypothetical protein U1E36_01305 [Rickettsiales bacterium]